MLLFLQNYMMKNHTKVKHMHMPVRGPLDDRSLAAWYVAMDLDMLDFSLPACLLNTPLPIVCKYIYIYIYKERERERDR